MALKVEIKSFGINNDPELMDYVAAVMPLLKERDKNAWTLGDIIVEAVDVLGIKVTAGRKKADDDQLTLGELAGMLNQPTPRVSEWLKCSALYPEEHRPHNFRAYEDLTWSHFNLARRKSGGELDMALTLLNHAVRLCLNYNSFKRWLNGEVWEGYLDYDQIPSEVQPFAKPDQPIWATFAYKDDAIGED